jgi:hypothetical protein
MWIQAEESLVFERLVDQKRIGLLNIAVVDP